jgi:hypothetical protein
MYACDKVSTEVKESAVSRQMVEQLTKTIRS